MLRFLRLIKHNWHAVYFCLMTSNFKQAAPMVCLMTINDLPAVNASLNLISAVFLSTGWVFIRRGLWRQHMACMIAAVISSTFFLTGYIIYHAHVGEKSSGYRGWIAAIYFPMLASHVLLAFVTLPLVIITLIQVFRRRWDLHKRIARWTLPIWLTFRSLACWFISYSTNGFHRRILHSGAS
jgi:putative membrane protein